MKKKRLALLLGLSAGCFAAASAQAHHLETHHEEISHEDEHHEEGHRLTLMFGPGPAIMNAPEGDESPAADDPAMTEDPAGQTEDAADAGTSAGQTKDTADAEDPAGQTKDTADAEDPAGQTEDDAEQTVITENTIGEEDGYGYELWKDEGDTTMTLTGDGTFTCAWSNINSALFRRGRKFDCTKTYKELGNISVDYEVDYEPVGNSYLCLYGWTRDPLIEYYIVDSWGSWRPPGGSPVGTVTVDGAEYDVYRTVREEQPSIDGTATFEQYWSVRREKRTEGTIDATAHFDAWESLGMPMGKFYEASLTVEGYQSEGEAAVLKNELKVGEEEKSTSTASDSE